jgi:cyclopropane fatty-acyl-phospholipid synthase-like methyltransferase
MNFHLEKVLKLYKNLDKRRNTQNTDYRWLNLGYWKSADKIFDACNDLLDLVIKQANIKNGSIILDVGCGYGYQDIVIANRFPLSKITAVNIVKEQIEFAKYQIKNTELEERIQFLEKDAVEIDFNENTFDNIIAIESAFHFNTRKAFLEKAYKVLKPNGTICLADGIQDFDKIKKHNNIQERLDFLGIPETNLTDKYNYVKMLEEIGYRGIVITDISENVIPFAATTISQNMDWRTNNQIKIPDIDEVLNNYLENFYKSTLFYQYVIISASK